MCIPSQITCNCYSKVFNAFNIFKVSSLQSIWSMDLLDPFSCQLHHIAFDRLKSHTPLPCPGTQSIFDLLTSFIQDSADKHIPSKTSRSVSSIPWITPEIRRKIRRKNKTHAKAKKTGSSKLRSKFETLRREIKADVRKQHDLYVNNLVGDGQRHVNRSPIDHPYKCHENTNHSRVPQLSKAPIPTSKWKYVPNLLQT